MKMVSTEDLSDLDVITSIQRKNNKKTRCKFQSENKEVLE